MKKIKLSKLVASCAVLASMAFMSQAQAAGTLAGTTVSNQANLNFSIGAVAQNPVASNTVSFLVDNKVNFIVTPDDGVGPTIGVPGSQVINKYKITNLGNSPQDFILNLYGVGFTGQSVFGKTDNIDLTGCQAFVDVNGNGTYEAATDTRTWVDELQPDAAREIFTVCTVPTTAVNNDFAMMRIDVTSAAGGLAGTQGAALTQTAGANTAGIDIVFAEAADTDNPAKNGTYSARHGVSISAAVLSIVKTNAPICDPVNFNNNPKNIPGAYVRYTITITNAASAGSSAILNTITDTINTTNLTFDADYINPTASACSAPTSAAGNSFKVSCTGGTRACVSTTAYRTGATDGDTFSYNTGSGLVTAGLQGVLPVETGYAAGELKAGESVVFEFNTVVK